MAAKNKHAPYLPVEYDAADIGAIQALARGDAPPETQQRALKWIIETVAGAYDLSYRPESDRDTAFAEGKRYVGLQLIKATKILISRLKE